MGKKEEKLLEQWKKDNKDWNKKAQEKRNSRKKRKCSYNEKKFFLKIFLNIIFWQCLKL